ncbi:MAG: substrate-binding domain-containing protein [Actinobacteria bacterium]|nr:substrate-binding domain-containing protein [Actinomycetota bacterium]
MLAAVIAVSSTLIIAACSSGSSNSSSNSSGGGSSGGGASSSGLAAAKAYEQQWLSAPTSINISTPLKSKPAAGKLLIGLDSGTGLAVVFAKYWAQAAKDAGWTYKDLNSGTTPAQQQATFNAAIQQNPAGILTSGIPESTLATGLALAQQKGIWVNSSADTDPPKGAMFDTSIANPDQLHQWGKMVAAYVVTQSGGKAVIQTFSLPVFPILYEFDKAFKAAIGQWCPDCKITEHPQQGSDIGTKTPQAVVSSVTRNPSTNWLIFDLGDLATGVNAALAAAGLHGLHIGGLTADVPNIQAVKSKTQDVWTLYSLPIVAYRQVDSFARKFEGMPTLNAALPTQLMTSDNVNSLVLDSQGNYVGVANYRAQFLKLWHVSG